MTIDQTGIAIAAGLEAEDNSDLRELLERQASLFSAHSADRKVNASATYIVFDAEYIFDRDTHKAYITGEGKEGDDQPRRKIHWPFHHIAAISWLSFRFLPGSDIPVIGGPFVLAADETDEAEMLTAFFAALRATGDGRLVSWGGEVRDYAVIRHLACVHGLVLPQQLRDTWPNARERLDLCRAVTVQADPVHLQEYAAASSIPSKPSPAKQIGAMAERGQWIAVRDHVLADVVTAAIIALRHLSSNSLIVCDRERTVQAVADAAGAAVPGGEFVDRTLKPWARDKLRAAGLRGKVFRAD